MQDCPRVTTHGAIMNLKKSLPILYAYKLTHVSLLVGKNYAIGCQIKSQTQQ